MKSVHEKANRATQIGQDRAQLARDIAALEEQIGVLQARDGELYSELCGLFGNKPAKTTKTTDAKPKKERKPRTPKAVNAGVIADDPDESKGVYVNTGSIEDIRASIVAYLRDAPPDARFSCAKIAESFTGGDTKLAAKALNTQLISTDGNKRGKIYWCEKAAETDERAEEDAAE
jgi:hypothetical protein